ncbi:hypothetical protein [Nocardioides daphniae]|uniref:Chemotaxis phosphatase CheX-like domain-containing protein n=1 Tax=Nocardioides daphniae TaxID=402297 RepID=A0A4P7UDJ3_9ACTN|nr:hypothetical protein [Nocardioides daphniae]QCC78156.1 hypothetical protein E2C04_14920 [Nocardioides daphniae]GGD21412.1 hypothetical protein GCM10007231_20760 [Nocardioides daphniae]
MKVHLPVAKEVRDLLSDLLGKSVSIEPAAPLAPGPKRPATIGVYVDDSLRIAALICFDLPLSAYAGAAIGLVPPKTAEDAVAQGTLPEVLRENLHEVLNIAVGLFNSTPGADHLRLHAMHPAGEPTPRDVLVHALTLGRRTDMRVDVPNYGAGVISVVQTF